MRWVTRVAVAVLAVAGSAACAPDPQAQPHISSAQPDISSAQPHISSASSKKSAARPVAWVGTWAVAMQSGDRAFQRQTLRQIVHTSIGGSAVRVRLSNQFGAEPLTVSSVYVALRARGGTVAADTARQLAFAGATSVTIPAGSSTVSDAAAFAVPALSDIAVSAYLPAATGPATEHAVGLQDNYIGAGEQSAAASMTGTRTTTSYFFLAGVDVRNPAATGAVVTFGASITDGLRSTLGADRRWPDLLAARLGATGRTVGVLNTGISGNKLLADGTGESALKRFDRDVLAQPGVRWVIVSDDPLNDLGGADPPTGARLVEGLKQLITRGHEAGLKLVCSTLTPFGESGYWTERGEQGRAEVNAFVRGAGSGCDAVLDQGAATHDPAAPTRYLAGIDSGDHLHPTDRGMRAIAGAVDLDWFGPGTS